MDEGPKLLADALEAAGLTRAELARRIGKKLGREPLKASTVSNWTTGYAKPGKDTLRAADEILEADGRILAAFGFYDGPPREALTAESGIRSDVDLAAGDKRVLLDLVELFKARRKSG